MLKFGDTFTFAPPPAAETNYKLSSAPAVAVITTRPDNATAAPALNAAVVAADVINYEVGTGFSLKYSYEPTNANYSGAYTYTFNYSVGPNTVTPPSSLVFGPSTVRYGEFQSKLPVAPADPLGSSGYIGTYVGAKVKTASPIADANSPAVGTDVDLSTNASELFNSGTVILMTYSYSPKPGYTGETITMTQDLVIAKGQVSGSGNTLRPLLDNSYLAGTDFRADTPTFVYSEKFNLADDSPKYYEGAFTGTDVPTDARPLSPSDIKAFGTGPNAIRFTVVWEFVAKPNYVYNSGMSYLVIQPYQVAEAVEYTGSITYPGVNVENGRQPSSAVTAIPWQLPETTGASNGDQFVLDTSYDGDGASYAITTAAGNDTLRIARSLAALYSYSVGTKVTAVYQFKGVSANAKAKTVKVTKVFTIVAAA